MTVQLATSWGDSLVASTHARYTSSRARPQNTSSWRTWRRASTTVPSLDSRTTYALRESPSELGAESELSAQLAALGRPLLLFIPFLITDKIRSHAVPWDRGTRILPMLGSSRLDQCALVIAERENRSFAPQRIPDLFDELESLPDGQPFEITRCIYHVEKSVRCSVRGQLLFLRCCGESSTPCFTICAGSAELGWDCIASTTRTSTRGEKTLHGDVLVDVLPVDAMQYQNCDFRRGDALLMDKIAIHGHEHVESSLTHEPEKLSIVTTCPSFRDDI